MGENAADNTSAIAELSRMTESAKKLFAEGLYEEALDGKEHILVHCKTRYELGSEELAVACEDLAKSYNVAGMHFLKNEDYQQALEVFQKAQILTDTDQGGMENEVRLKLKAITLNNLGCFHKRQGRLKTALKFTELALKIEVVAQGAENPAGTYLNMCAILSELGRHQEALDHASCALELLQAEEDSNPQNYGYNEGGSGDGSDGDGDQLDELGEEGGGPVKSNSSLLAIACHNIAAEYEHLQKPVSAMRFYKQACEVAERQMGSNHPLTHALLNHAGEAYRNLQSIQHEKAVKRKERAEAKREAVHGGRPGSHGAGKGQPRERAASGQR